MQIDISSCKFQLICLNHIKPCKVFRIGNSNKSYIQSKERAPAKVKLGIWRLPNFKVPSQKKSGTNSLWLVMMLIVMKLTSSKPFASQRKLQILATESQKGCNLKSQFWRILRAYLPLVQSYNAREKLLRKCEKCFKSQLCKLKNIDRK